MIRSLLKKCIASAVKHETLWALLDATILNVAGYAQHERSKVVLSNAIDTIFPDFVVKHGVFRGMKYLPEKSINEIFCKLLGSYEKEIHGILDSICQNRYSEIVNIGCAEGYYAVGLALRIPTAKVYAYDLNENALSRCRKMAALNNVEDRLITGNFCDGEVLKAIPFTGKALIVCDCEGYEKELFSPEIASHLQDHDLLIETHDFLDVTISSSLHNRFAPTHNIETARSIDDTIKAQVYSYDELAGYDLPTRKFLLAEGRLAIMEWLYLTSRG